MTLTRFRSTLTLISNALPTTRTFCRLWFFHDGSGLGFVDSIATAPGTVVVLDTATGTLISGYLGRDWHTANQWGFFIWSDTGFGGPVHWQGTVTFTDATGDLSGAIDQTATGGIASPARFGPFPITASPICQYGTEKKGTATAVEVGLGLLEDMGLIRGAGAWAVPLLIANTATPILLDELCSGPPLGDQTIGDADWNTPNPAGPGSLAIAKVIAKFQTELWNFFCR